MEKVKRKAEKTNPVVTANWFSKLFFSWMNPLFRIGYKRSLEGEDLYNVLPEYRSKTLGETLQRYWDEECLKASKDLKEPSLFKAIIFCHWKFYAVLTIITFIEEATKLVQPVLLGYLLHYFETYDPNDYHGLQLAFCYAFGISLCSLLLVVMHHLYFHNQKVGMKIRVALCHMIYKKALCLSNSATGKTTTGQIVNLLSNDVGKFDELTIWLQALWVAPIQVAVVVALLWAEIGPSCLAGILVPIILMPLQTLFGRLFSMFRSRMAVLTDSRIRTMNEVVFGMHIIKMYAWEKHVASLVSRFRGEEINNVMKSSMLQALNLASFFSASKVIIFITFAIYVQLGNTITASSVFVTVSLYSNTATTVNLFFPRAIELLFESNVSVQRIQNFLMLEELPKCSDLVSQAKNASVIIEDLVCYWDKNQDPPSLQNVSLSLGSRQLVAVIGPVGAGKSSLLSAILGELPLDKGVLKVKGQLTYACQQPWVFPGTIRSNILFGKELNPAKYEEVLRACALKRDMELLPDGDLTLIGDRGATLSGGQKARVNLARAVYLDADIYLLDDPLSAVDAEVGRHLFEKCICGILKDKPRILVTHQLQYLKAADQILVLKGGNVVAKGGYTELQKSGLDFTSLLKKEDEAEQQAMSEELARSRTVSSTSSPTVNDEAEQIPAEHTQTAVEESRLQGTIGMGMYYKYIRAGANVFVLLVLFVVNISAQVAYVLQDWWMSYWADKQSNLTGCTTSIQNHTNNATEVLDIPFYLGIYGGLTAATLIFGLVRAMLFIYVLVKSTETLHKRMFNAILRTPVHFFDVNPIGRVLNRFSKDIGEVDLVLPWTFVDACQIALHMVGVIAVAASVVPWILILVVPLLIIFVILRRYFLKTSRDIKRLERTTRSPMISHLSSSLQGLWTIRAFRAEQRFQNVFDAHQDRHSETWYLLLCTTRWFAMRLELLCAVFVIILTFACMSIRDDLGAGDVGLALSYAISIVGMFQWGVRQSAEVENLMISVERVMEYTELESEAPWETEKRPPLDWPSQGLVTFDGVNFSYSADGPVVLRNMNATFLPREKVGVVGRTGAGKSSLVSALFRLAEPQGKIYVDGILTSELGLHDLRQKMSIIPQDPVLFTDTIRNNLDPFSQHSDEELWNSLQEVQLKSVVEELPTKMETLLAESGSNFSVGQRQLVCLARAILRKNRILIIDEATANVDPRTDELIQRTIRDKFRDCTVLTIAHRLNTIIDSDRIMVLDAGEIKAYDAPYTLLQDPEGIFYKMVQQTGQQEAEDLLASAKQAYENRSHSINKHSSATNGNLVFHETVM
ncbi:unnamed protein product [Arctogadus glacialis]